MTVRHLPEDLDRRLAAELVPTRPTPYVARAPRPRVEPPPITPDEARRNFLDLAAAIADWEDAA